MEREIKFMQRGMCTIQQKIIDQITILIKFRNFLCLIRPIFLFLCNIVAEWNRPLTVRRSRSWRIVARKWWGIRRLESLLRKPKLQFSLLTSSVASSLVAGTRKRIRSPKGRKEEKEEKRSKTHTNRKVITWSGCGDTEKKNRILTEKKNARFSLVPESLFRLRKTFHHEKWEIGARMRYFNMHL